MTHLAQQILQQAEGLSTLDRAALIEGLIASLDKPDDTMDTLWLKKAEESVRLRMNRLQKREIGACFAKILVEYLHFGLEFSKGLL